MTASIDSHEDAQRHSHTIRVSQGQGLTVHGFASLAQGLRIIGYGFMVIAVAIVISVSIVVTYWNAQ